MIEGGFEIEDNSNVMGVSIVNSSLIVPAETVQEFCPDIPPSFGTISVEGPNGLTTGSSDIGNFVIDPLTGCVTFTATDRGGLDTIPVMICDLATNACIQNNILATVQPANDTLRVTVQEGLATEICLSPDQLARATMSLEICGQPQNGSVSVLGTTTCGRYIPSDSLRAGDTDMFCLMLCDAQGVCDTSFVVVTVEGECTGLFTTDSMEVTTTQCAQGYPLCINIPLNQMANFDFAIDGEPYTGPFEGCMNDSIFSYTFFPVPNQGQSGPYLVERWSIGLDTFSGEFQTIAELVDSMNVWDVRGEWTMNPAMMLIQGGYSGNIYGSLIIRQIATNALATLELNTNLLPNGTSIRIPVGTHIISVTDRIQNCTDNMVAIVTCNSCPEIYTGPTVIETTECAANSICLNINPAQVANFEFILNGNQIIPQACDPDTSVVYSLNVLPPGMVGPYRFSWNIAGEMLTSTFDTLPELVDEMNRLDGAPVWSLNDSLGILMGGRNGVLYGDIVITQMSTEDTFTLVAGEEMQATTLSLPLVEGMNTVMVRGLLNDCDYNFNIEVDCSLAEILADADMETTLLIGEEETICFNMGQLDTSITSILNICPDLSGDMISYALDSTNYCVTITGQNIGTEALCIELCDDSGLCDTTKIVISVVPIASLDTVQFDIVRGQMEEVCLEEFVLSGPFASIANTCDTLGGMSSEIIVNQDSICFEIMGLEVGQDTACMVMCDINGDCNTTVFVINVRLPQTDTVPLSILLNRDSSYCMDLGELVGNITSFENVCASPTFATVNLNTVTACLNIMPDSIGMDTLCLVACDQNGTCDTTILQLNIVDMESDLIPIAVDDDSLTIKNSPLVLNVLGNDTINGMLLDFSIITDPLNGTAFVNPDQTVTYVPNTDFCGLERDTFMYVVENIYGIDTATVSILTTCEEITVFSGISPNGDGINDSFQVFGIEAFPENEVTIFNRWGNVVFTKKGYTNQEGWTGTFDSDLLPDGTYFYVIDLGNGSQPLSGYVQIRR